MDAEPVDLLQRRSARLASSPSRCSRSRVRSSCERSRSDCGHLAHLVAGPGNLLGLLPERLEPRLELELPPDQAEVQVGPLHVPSRVRRTRWSDASATVTRAAAASSRNPRFPGQERERSGAPARSWWARRRFGWPRSRRSGCRVRASGRGGRQPAERSSRSAVTSACARACSGLAARVWRRERRAPDRPGRNQRRRERRLVGGRDPGQLEQDETEKRGHGASASSGGVRPGGAGQALTSRTPGDGTRHGPPSGRRPGRAVYERSGRFREGGGGAGACETGSSARTSRTATGAATTRAGTMATEVAGRGARTGSETEVAPTRRAQGSTRGGPRAASPRGGRAVPAALVDRLGPPHHRTDDRVHRARRLGGEGKGAARR